MPEENKNDPSEDWSDNLLPRTSKNEGTFMSAGGTNQPAEVRPTENFEPNLKPKKSHKGLIILLIVLLILAGLGVGGWFAYQKYSSQILSSFGIKNNKQSEQPKQEQNVDDNDQIVKDMQRKADIAKKEIIKKYPKHSDVYISEIDVMEKNKGIKKVTGISALSLTKKIGKNEENLVGNYVFTFNTPKGDAGGCVAVEINTDKITEIEFEDFTPSIKDTEKIFSPIQLDKIKIGYKKLFELLDKNGGEEFKKQNINIEQIGPILMYDSIRTKNNSWSIGYSVGKLGEKNFKSIELDVDPNSGKINHKSELPLHNSTK